MSSYYEFHTFEADGVMVLYVTWQDGKYGQPVGEVSDCMVAAKEDLAEAIVAALNSTPRLVTP